MIILNIVAMQLTSAPALLLLIFGIQARFDNFSYRLRLRTNSCIKHMLLISYIVLLSTVLNLTNDLDCNFHYGWHDIQLSTTQLIESIFQMAANRDRRSNAGMKMASLLDKEEVDEFYQTTYGGFEEVENDKEFHYNSPDEDDVVS